MFASTFDDYYITGGCGWETSDVVVHMTNGYLH